MVVKGQKIRKRTPWLISHDNTRCMAGDVSPGRFEKILVKNNRIKKHTGVNNKVNK